MRRKHLIIGIGAAAAAVAIAIPVLAMAANGGSPAPTPTTTVAPVHPSDTWSQWDSTAAPSPVASW